MVVGALLLVAAYFFTAFLHGQFFYIFVTFIPYYFMLPTFVMVRSVVAVALCRILTDMRTVGGHRFSQFSGVTLVRCLVQGVVSPQWCMCSMCNIHDISWGTKGCTLVLCVGERAPADVRLWLGAVDTVQTARQRTALRDPPRPLHLVGAATCIALGCTLLTRSLRQMSEAEMAEWDRQCQAAADEDRRRLKEAEANSKQVCVCARSGTW